MVRFQFSYQDIKIKETENKKHKNKIIMRPETIYEINFTFNYTLRRHINVVADIQYMQQSFTLTLPF